MEFASRAPAPCFVLSPRLSIFEGHRYCTAGSGIVRKRGIDASRRATGKPKDNYVSGRGERKKWTAGVWIVNTSGYA